MRIDGEILAIATIVLIMLLAWLWVDRTAVGLASVVIGGVWIAFFLYPTK